MYLEYVFYSKLCLHLNEYSAHLAVDHTVLCALVSIICLTQQDDGWGSTIAASTFITLINVCDSVCARWTVSSLRLVTPVLQVHKYRRAIIGIAVRIMIHQSLSKGNHFQYRSY